MLFVIEILPLSLNGRIGLHVYMTLAPLEIVLLIDGYQVVEEQGVGTLGAILGQDAYEEQIDNVGLVELQSANDVPPTEG